MAWKIGALSQPAYVKCRASITTLSPYRVLMDGSRKASVSGSPTYARFGAQLFVREPDIGRTGAEIGSPCMAPATRLAVAPSTLAG